MAVSSAKSTTNTKIKYTIEVIQNSQSVTGNTSNVTVKVRFYRTNTGYTTYGSGTVYCKINGTQYSAAVTSSQKITNSGIVLFSKTLNIPHNADGTKTLTCSAWINHSQFSSSEQSYSQTLTTIPRASIITSITGNTIGSPVTVNIQAYSSSFTHKYYYSFGDSVNVPASNPFTPILSDCNYIPNSTSGVATIKLETYSGGTLIGTTTKTFTLNVPSTVVPTCKMTVVDEMGYEDIYGGFIQGLSKLRVTVTGTPAYSSPISKYGIVANNVTYWKSTIVTEPITNSDHTYVYCVVTDARGRQGWIDGTFPVLSYEQPKITNFSVHRCNDDGEENIQGEYVNVSYDCSVSSLNNKNKLTTVIRYKKTKDTAYITHTDINNSTTTSYTRRSVILPAASDSSYDIEIGVNDNFVTVRKNTSVSTAFAFHHYKGPNELGKNLISIPEGIETGTSLIAYAEVVAGESYTLTVSQTLTAAAANGNTQFQHWYKFFDVNNNVLEESTIAVCYFAAVGDTCIQTQTITAPTGAVLVSIDVGCYYNGDNAPTGITNYAQLELGDTATEYEVCTPKLLPSMGLGKLAELEGGLDVGFKTRFAGGLEYPILEPETDLDDIRTPNFYAGANISHYNYTNCPITNGTFYLEVVSMGEEGQVRQRITSCSKESSITYERTYYLGSWGAWRNCYVGEEVIYDNSAGTNGTVTLSVNASQYMYLEIFYYYGGGYYSSEKIANPNGKKVNMKGVMINHTSSAVYVAGTTSTINGTTITPNYYGEYTVTSNSFAFKESRIFITKVVGYR